MHIASPIRAAALLWLAAPAALALHAQSASSPHADRPTLRAGRGAQEVRVDGRLDEAVWQRADSIWRLTEIEPREGREPEGRTVVRVLADGDVIVIGVRADDPDPRGPVSFARARDASLNSEDNVRIVLDSYLDGRSGYVFSMNPTGARYDALITGQGGENGSWDTIWEGRAVRTATGWSAEMRIPSRSLLFKRGLTTWGLNVQRRVQRVQRTDRWATPERDYSDTQMSRAGLLTDIPDLTLGVGLSVRPAVTAGGAASVGVARTTQRGASLDATQRFGGNSLAVLTVNTDFAETEVDTRRTNLTRFPVSFPEKRSFFLDGSDIFDFGLGLGSTDPFFSRRVGLLQSRPVPIDVGTKVISRNGGTNVGALVVRTGRLDTLPSAATLGVVRVKQNVLQTSSVGAIATFGDPQGRGGSVLAGADFTYETSSFRGSKNLVAGAWGLATRRDELGGDRGAYGVQLAYPNDRLELELTARSIGAGFQPSLGFVPRPGVRQYLAEMNFKPRPTRPVLGLRVRQMFHELFADLTTTQDDEWESYRLFTAPVNWRLESGDRFELNAAPAGERLRESFEIADDVVIPAGSYHWTRYRVEAGTASRRQLSAQANWWFGGFYSGTLDEIRVTGTWKPSALLAVDVTLERNIGRLREGSFTQDLVGTRVRVNLSPDLTVNSFVQYDNESSSVGTNTRLRWTFSPVGELFVVYNHNLDTLDPITERRRLGYVSNQLLVKAQYALRY